MFWKKSWFPLSSVPRRRLPSIDYCPQLHVPVSAGLGCHREGDMCWALLGWDVTGSTACAKNANSLYKSGSFWKWLKLFSFFATNAEPLHKPTNNCCHSRNFSSKLQTCSDIPFHLLVFSSWADSVKRKNQKKTKNLRGISEPCPV